MCFLFLSLFFFFKKQTKHQSCVKQHSVSNVRLVSCSTRSCLPLGHSRRALDSASSLTGFQSKKKKRCFFITTTSENYNLRINRSVRGNRLDLLQCQERKDLESAVKSVKINGQTTFNTGYTYSSLSKALKQTQL